MYHQRRDRRNRAHPPTTNVVVFTKFKGPRDFARDQGKEIQNDKTNKRKGQSREDDEVAVMDEHRHVNGTPSLHMDRATELPATIENASLLEHIATSRFFHHYVSPRRSFCRLDLDYTTSVIDQSTKRSVLAEVIIALGILTLPRRTSASCTAARCRYSRALRLTNKALEDTAEAKSDGVLMAVILLGLFEVSSRFHLHCHAIGLQYPRVDQPHSSYQPLPAS